MAVQKNIAIGLDENRHRVDVEPGVIRGGQLGDGKENARDEHERTQRRIDRDARVREVRHHRRDGQTCCSGDEKLQHQKQRNCCEGGSRRMARGERPRQAKVGKTKRNFHVVVSSTMSGSTIFGR